MLPKRLMFDGMQPQSVEINVNVVQATGAVLFGLLAYQDLEKVPLLTKLISCCMPVDIGVLFSTETMCDMV
jgi:hypothetical protein